MLSRLLLTILVLIASGCADQSPTTSPSPSLPAPATPSPDPEPMPARERWNLTITLRGFSGPDACSTYMNHAGADDWSMTVERSGESIHLDISPLDDPDVHIRFNGTVVADVLTAAATNPLQGRVCGGSKVTLGVDLHLSGHFSGDGHSLAAEEVRSSRLSSGETLVFHLVWNATRE